MKKAMDDFKVITLATHSSSVLIQKFNYHSSHFNNNIDIFNNNEYIDVPLNLNGNI